MVDIPDFVNPELHDETSNIDDTETKQSVYHQINS